MYFKFAKANNELLKLFKVLVIDIFTPCGIHSVIHTGNWKRQYQRMHAKRTELKRPLYKAQYLIMQEQKNKSFGRHENLRI